MKDVVKKMEGPAVDGGFLKAMQGYREGETLNELSSGLRAAVEAAQQTGKVSEVNLKVLITPHGAAVMMTTQVKLKLPEEKAKPGVFFVDDECNLLRNDPRQNELTLRTVESEKPGELRKAVGQ